MHDTKTVAYGGKQFGGLIDEVVGHRIAPQDPALKNILNLTGKITLGLHLGEEKNVVRQLNQVGELTALDQRVGRCVCLQDRRIKSGALSHELEHLQDVFMMRKTVTIHLVFLV